jgi:type I restriction enzyme S subunit
MLAELQAEEQGVMPKLRFPEFQDTGDWLIAPLNQLATRRTRKNSEGKLKCVLTNSAEYGVIDQRDYFDKDIANQSNLEGYSIVENGDYVYNPRVSINAPVGPISKNNIGTGVMSPLYTVFRFNSSDNDFYAQFFKSTHWHQYLRLTSSTGARHDRMAITNDDFMNMPLPVSTSEEQKKIADCFFSLDELITTHTKKLDKLKKHKKGLMQQLFPAEGETVPKLRFPEFQEAGEWKEDNLEVYFPHIRNGFVGIATPYYSIQGIPYLQGKNIKQARIDATNLIRISVDFHHKQKKSQLREDDILMVQSGHVGECALVGKQFSGSNCHALIILSPAKNTESNFFIHFFYSGEGLRKIGNVKTGNTIAHILSSDLKTLRLYVPSQAEQKKIASCLSVIDEQTSKQAQRIETLKAHKRGLMQQLFPVLGEEQSA